MQYFKFSKVTDLKPATILKTFTDIIRRFHLHFRSTFFLKNPYRWLFPFFYSHIFKTFFANETLKIRLWLRCFKKWRKRTRNWHVSPKKKTKKKRKWLKPGRNIWKMLVKFELRYKQSALILQFYFQSYTSRSFPGFQEHVFFIS